MADEVEHSGLKVGEPIVVKRNGVTYVIPGPADAAAVKTMYGRFMTKEAVEYAIAHYFGE